MGEVDFISFEEFYRKGKEETDKRTAEEIIEDIRSLYNDCEWGVD